MSTVDLIIKNGEVLTPEGIKRAGIAVQGEVIFDIDLEQNLPSGKEQIDANGKIIIPGFIDSHVHFREPGFEYKETWETGSRAAAAGGVTMCVGMPNTSPPPRDVEAWDLHIKLASEGSCVDFNHWALPTKLDQIVPIAERGTIGFKFFMKRAHYPYNPETSIVDDAEILLAIQEIRKTGLPLCFHPHNQNIWDYKIKKWTDEGRTDLETYAEVSYGDHDINNTTGIAKMIILANAIGVRLRVLHLQGRDQFKLVKAMRAGGYDFINEANPWGVFNIRPITIMGSEEEYWEAFNDGTIDLIATDHAPHSREEFEQAQRNVHDSVIVAYPQVEHYMSLFLTEVNNGKITLERLSKLCSENVARHLGVYPRKGVIQKGADADLAIIDMKERRTISEDYPVYSKMGYSPYEGVAVQGVPIRTIVRGKTVMENGDILGKKGYGKYISPTK